MKASPLILDAALRYAQRRWSVFPLHTVRNGHCTCGNLDCENTGKHPRTPHGFKDATCDITLIAKWWAMGDSNIAIVTGPRSGLLVVDVDVRKDGEASLGELERQNGALPETVETITGSGGRHLYFKYPGVTVHDSAGKLGPGLDIRGEGGYVVAPPSLHVSGQRYCWEVAHHPDDVPLAYPPAWLLELLAEPGGVNQNNRGSVAWKHLLERIPEGRRNSTLTSVAGWLRLYHPQGVVAAILQAINLARCEPPLEESEVTSIVGSVFRYAQPGVNGHPKAAVPRYTRNEADNE